MKRILAVLLFFLLVIATLASCGTNGSTDATVENQTETESDSSDNSGDSICVHVDDNKDDVCDECSSDIKANADSSNSEEKSDASDSDNSNGEDKSDDSNIGDTPCVDADKNHVCDDCGAKTSHNYVDGVCTLCGTSISSWDGTVGADYASGEGTEESPFIINTASQLAFFASKINSGITYNGIYFKLDANIDLMGKEWAPIGNADIYFRGVFDGNNKSISNFKIASSDMYIGLFGYNAGTIKNLGVSEFNLDVTPPTGYIGALVGYNVGTVSDCYAEGKVRAIVDTGYVGCLMGYNNNGTVSGCYSTGELESIAGGAGNGHAGGLLGLNNAGSVIDSYTTVTVKGSGAGKNYTGGFVGYNNATVTNCYATGKVNGLSTLNAYTGGFCGTNHENGTITNCHATGDITDNDSKDAFTGGFLGHNNGTINKCYATGNVKCVKTAGGFVGCNNKKINNCYASGNVNDEKNKLGTVGGFAGINDDASYSRKTEIKNCYALGDVYGENAGGLVAFNKCAYNLYTTGNSCYSSSVINCYAIGNVYAQKAGGLVCDNYSCRDGSARVTNSYAIGDVSGSESSGGLLAVGSSGVSNSYRYIEQALTGTDKNMIGTEKELSSLTSVTFQATTLTWSVSDWVFTEGEHPVLKDVGANIQ